MKCANCGSNLDLETRFCPYCGTENKAAKQHVADMEKYAKDYKATKDEVLTNSRKFNAKTFKITVVAVTIAAIALLILLCVNVGNLNREYSRGRKSAKAEKYYSEIVDLMQRDDYFALYELIERENIYFNYGTKLYDFYDVRGITYYFANAYSDIMMALQPGGNERGYIAQNLSDCVKTILTKETDSKEALVIQYVSDVQRDTKLLLKTYLNMTDEELEDYMTLTDAGKALLIEEKYNEAASK